MIQANYDVTFSLWEGNKQVVRTATVKSPSQKFDDLQEAISIQERCSSSIAIIYVYPHPLTKEEKLYNEGYEVGIDGGGLSDSFGYYVDELPHWHRGYDAGKAQWRLRGGR